MTDDGSASGDGVLDISTPTKIAEAANRIYAEKFKEEYEKKYKGKYVAIDVRTGASYIGDSSDDASENARRKAPYGVFHLIRVGSRSAFKVTRSVKRDDDWLWAS